MVVEGVAALLPEGHCRCVRLSKCVLRESKFSDMCDSLVLDC